MNENKKLMIMGFLIIAVLSIIPITAIVTNVKSKKTLEKFYDYIDSSELKVVYIGRDDCSYCQVFAPEIELIQEEYNVDYLYINTNNLKDNHLNELLEELEIDTSNFGTPYLVVTKDGKKVAEQSGYVTEDQLFGFFKEQTLIDESETLPLNYIDYDEYTKLINSDSKELIVIAQSGCPGCLKARPIIYELAKQYDVKINYLNVSVLDEEAGNNFQASLTYFTENGISTPLMMIVSNKEVIDAVTGSVEKEVYEEFLKENQLINE